jgi:hypothetical protein
LGVCTKIGIFGSKFGFLDQNLDFGNANRPSGNPEADVTVAPKSEIRDTFFSGKDVAAKMDPTGLHWNQFYETILEVICEPKKKIRFVIMTAYGFKMPKDPRLLSTMFI